MSRQLMLERKIGLHGQGWCKKLQIRTEGATKRLEDDFSNNVVDVDDNSENFLLTKINLMNIVWLMMMKILNNLC